MEIAAHQRTNPLPVDMRHVGVTGCSTLPAEAPAITAFVDKFMLGQPDANTDVEVNPYPTLDYARWTAWWGGDPDYASQSADDRQLPVVPTTRGVCRGLLVVQDDDGQPAALS